MPATFIDGTGHRGETDYEFSILTKYFTVSEAAIPSAERSAREQLEASLASYSREERMDIGMMQYLSHSASFHREFPLRLRYGFLIQLYALMEERAKSLSRVIIERDHQQCKGLGEHYPQGFMNAFEKWVSTNSSGQSTRWQDGENLRVIRNCIVHANGRVSGDKKPQKVRETLEKLEGAEEDRFGFISVKASCCTNICEQIRALFNDIYQSTGFGSSFFLSSREPTAILIDTSGDIPRFSTPDLEET
jgi:hypothetical protein